MTDRLVPVGRLLLLLLTTTVIVLSFCGVPFTHAAARTCVSARVGSAFRLPDGALHPPGLLTVCRAQTFSPVGVLHLISVNRRPMGMFVGRSHRSEGPGASSPEIVFRRRGDGQLELLGYTVPARGRSLVHRLIPSWPKGAGSNDGGWEMPVVAAMAR